MEKKGKLIHKSESEVTGSYVKYEGDETVVVMMVVMV